MNIQIFGKSKCFDTKKAERYFKERNIKFQSIDIMRFSMSRGEFDSVRKALGSIEAMLNEKADLSQINYLAYEEDKIEKILDDPRYLKTPIVRNGRQATVGYQPEIWKTWE